MPYRETVERRQQDVASDALLTALGREIISPELPAKQNVGELQRDLERREGGKVELTKCEA